MSSGLYSHTTRGPGTILTAAIYNADHSNHITNLNPTMAGGYSDTVGQMQTVADPGGSGSEVLAPNLAGELARIRYAIKRITGTAQWYVAPVTDLATIGGGIPLVLSFAATPLTIRRTENDTTEREFNSVRSGSGAGNKYSQRLVGTAANAIGEIREYIGAVELFRQTIAIRTNQLIQHFNAGWTLGAAGVQTIIGNVAGFFDFTEITVPANPPANIGRIYAKDISGLTRLAYRDSVGTEIPLIPTDTSIYMTDVRLGTEGSVASNNQGGQTGKVPSGCMMTGIIQVTNTNGVLDTAVSFLFYRPVQKQINNGSYVTVSQV